jgi:sugar O-acyltransferase (sialic acid O-acetyltransferase NeuD family)
MVRFKFLGMKKALIGGGGHAREVMLQIGENFPCFVDDQYITEYTLPLSTFNPLEYEVMIAVGSSTDRLNIKQRLPKKTKYFSFIHPTSIVGNDVKIGEGSFIGAYSIITSNINIGDHALLNRANHIGHDTQIGSYLSMMPGAIISGNCKICDCVYIGTNATIRENISIPSLSIIGMNAAVVKNIEESGKYVGVPAKKINL